MSRRGGRLDSNFLRTCPIMGNENQSWEGGRDQIRQLASSVELGARAVTNKLLRFHHFPVFPVLIAPI